MRLRAAIALLAVLVLLGGCVGGLAGSDDGDDGSGSQTVDGDVAGCTELLDDGDDTDDVTANDTDEQTQFQFENVAGEVGFDYQSVGSNAENGNDGVYVTDYDNDLREDVLLIGGRAPVLCENSGGEFEGTDAVPDVQGQVQGALFFDHDNDGWEDLLLLRHSDAPVFFENDGGEFEEANVGFDHEFVEPTAASAADYDGDGCLDVFVVDYSDWTQEDPPTQWRGSADVDEDDNGAPNVLFRGDCETFEVADDAGIEGEHWSLATSFADVTGNGHPDIHVANDYWNDVFYENNGDGTFDRRYLDEYTDRNGMSSNVADVTGDGQMEIFVTNIYYPRERTGELSPTSQRLFSNQVNGVLGGRNYGNNLLVWTGDGFEDQAEERGLAHGGWGWASTVEDLDSDGDLDVFHSNQELWRFGGDYPHFTRGFAYAQENGEFVRQNSSAIGIEANNDRGLAALDLAVDGRMDIAVGTHRGGFAFYRNVGEQGNSFQVVVGGDGEHTPIGAQIEVTVDDDVLHSVNNAKGDYQSQDTRTHHFGLGNAEVVDELVVEWPDGTTRTFEDVDAGQRIYVTPDGIDERLAYDDTT